MASFNPNPASCAGGVGEDVVLTSGLGSVLRLASLWEDELRSKGSDASLCWVVWSFCRGRLLLSILCLAVTQLAGFSGPVSQAQSDQYNQ